MTNSQQPTVTRQQNGARYEYTTVVNGETLRETAKALYTHASYTLCDSGKWMVRFHKTEAAALKNTQRAGYLEIG